MTLDEAQEAFEANPTLATGYDYYRVGCEYLDDEMIQKSTLWSILEQIKSRTSQ